MLTLPKTKRAINELNCTVGRDEYRCTTFPALYLFVGPQSETWYLKCSHKKKRYRIKIAPCSHLSYQKALQCSTELYHSIVMGTYAFNKSISVPLFCDFFETHYLPSAKINKRSWKSDQSKFITYFKSEFRGLQLDTITKIKIEAYLNTLGLKPATRNKHRSLLSTIFNQAIEEGFIEINPVKGIKVLKENNERVSFFTDNQSIAFDRTAQNDSNEDASNLLLCLKKTGARLSELQYLEFSNIDFDRKSIHVNLSKSGYSRQIYLSDEAVAILRYQSNRSF